MTKLLPSLFLGTALAHTLARDESMSGPADESALLCCETDAGHAYTVSCADSPSLPQTTPKQADLGFGTGLGLWLAVRRKENNEELDLPEYFEPFRNISREDNNKSGTAAPFTPQTFTSTIPTLPQKPVKTYQTVIRELFEAEGISLGKSLQSTDNSVARLASFFSANADFYPLEDIVGLIGAAQRAEKLGFDKRGLYYALLNHRDLSPHIAELNRVTQVSPRNLKNDLKQSEDPNRSIVELVSNALDHSRKSENPDVDITLADGFYEVLDRGSGMSPDKIIESLLLPKVSDKPDSAENIGGFGIGFYTVFAHLKKNGDQVVVDTKTAAGDAHRITFILKSGRIVMRILPLADSAELGTHGTRIRVFSDTISYKALTEKIFEFHRHIPSARALRINGERVNSEHEPETLESGDGYTILHKPAAQDRIVIMCGDVIIEQHAPEYNSGIGEYIIALPAGVERLSMARTQIKVDDKVIAAFMALAQKVAIGFTSPENYGTKIALFNLLAPLARAFEKDRRNETATDCIQELVKVAADFWPDIPHYPASPAMHAVIDDGASSFFIDNMFHVHVAGHGLDVPEEFKGGYFIGHAKKRLPLKLFLCDDLRVSHHFDENQGIFYLSRKFYLTRPAHDIIALFKIPNLVFHVDWRLEKKFKAGLAHPEMFIDEAHASCMLSKSSPQREDRENTDSSDQDAKDARPHVEENAEPPVMAMDKSQAVAKPTVVQSNTMAENDYDKLATVTAFLKGLNLELPGTHFVVSDRFTRGGMLDVRHGGIKKFSEGQKKIFKAGDRTLVYIGHPLEPGFYDTAGNLIAKIPDTKMPFPNATSKDQHNRKITFPHGRLHGYSQIAYDKASGRILLTVEYNEDADFCLDRMSRVYALNPDGTYEILAIEARTVTTITDTNGAVYFITHAYDSVGNSTYAILNANLEPIFTGCFGEGQPPRYLGTFGGRAIFFTQKFVIPGGIERKFYYGDGREVEELSGAHDVDWIQTENPALVEHFLNNGSKIFSYQLYKSGDMYGLITASGNIFPAIYDAFHFMEDDHLAVYLDGTIIFLDENGQELKCRPQSTANPLNTVYRCGNEMRTFSGNSIYDGDGNILLTLPNSTVNKTFHNGSRGNFFYCENNDGSFFLVDGATLKTYPLSSEKNIADVIATAHGPRFYTYTKEFSSLEAPEMPLVFATLLGTDASRLEAGIYHERPFFIAHHEEDTTDYTDEKARRGWRTRSSYCHLLDIHGNSLVKGVYSTIKPIEGGGFYLEGGDFNEEDIFIITPMLDRLSRPEIQAQLGELKSLKILTQENLAILCELELQTLDLLIGNPDRAKFIPYLTHPANEVLLQMLDRDNEKFVLRAMQLVSALLLSTAPQPQMIAKRALAAVYNADIDIQSALNDAKLGRHTDDIDALRYVLLSDDDGLVARPPRIPAPDTRAHPLADVITHLSTGIAKKTAVTDFHSVPAYGNKQDLGTVNMAIRQLRHGNPFLYIRELVQNAVDATKRVRDPAKKKIEIETFKHAGALHVSVKDGLGMTPAEFFGDFLPPEKSGKTNPLYQALEPALTWWRGLPAAQSIMQSAKPFTAILEGLDFYRALEDALDSRGGALGGFGFGFYSVIDGSDWVRVKTAQEGADFAIVAEYRVTRKSNGEIEKVEIALDTVSTTDGFVGTLVETKRRSRLVALDAKRTQVNASELCTYLNANEVTAIVNGEIVNGKRTFFTSDRWNGMGKVELWDSPKPMILLSGLPVGEFSRDIFDSLPKSIRKFYEQHGFAINLDARRVRTTPARDRFENHAEVMAQIRRMLPGLLIKGYLEKVASGDADLSFIPQEYFISAYDLAGSGKIPAHIIKDARKLASGGGIDGAQYTSDRKLTLLITELPFMRVAGIDKLLSLRDLYFLVHACIAAGETDLPAHLKAAIPAALHGPIITSMMHGEIEKNERISLKEKMIVEKDIPSAQAKVPEAYETAMKIRKQLTDAFDLPGNTHHYYSTRARLMSAAAATITVHARKNSLGSLRTFFMSDLRDLPDTDNIIYWPLTESNHTRMRVLYQIACQDDARVRRHLFQEWIATEVETISHELTHLITERFDGGDFTHDIKFFGDQMIILLNGQRAVIDIDALMEKFLLPLRDTAPPPPRDEVLRGL